MRSQALEASLYTDMLAYIHSIARTCMCAAASISVFVDSAVVCICTAFVIVNLPMPGFLCRSIAPRSRIVDSPALLFVLALVCSRRFARVCNRKLAYAETKYIIPSPTDPEL